MSFSVNKDENFVRDLYGEVLFVPYDDQIGADFNRYASFLDKVNVMHYDEAIAKVIENQYNSSK